MGPRLQPPHSLGQAPGAAELRRPFEMNAAGTCVGVGLATALANVGADAVVYTLNLE
jgi:hypothetical protein